MNSIMNLCVFKLVDLNIFSPPPLCFKDLDKAYMEEGIMQDVCNVWKQVYSNARRGKLHNWFLHQLLFDLSFNSNCFSILYRMFSCFFIQDLSGREKIIWDLKATKKISYLDRQNHKKQGNSVISPSYGFVQFRRSPVVLGNVLLSRIGLSGSGL
jgi:hypothetical protein